MKDYQIGIRFVLICLLLAGTGTVAVRAEEPESQRLQHAKDLIGDEQWARAVEELRAAVADPKERSKDEALFWLAHSQHQARDSFAAIETINRLEREYPSSPYVKPARSLRLEIAQRMPRRDFLWWTAVPPAPPAPVHPPATTPPAAVPPYPPSAPAPPPPAPKAVTPVRTPAPTPPVPAVATPRPPKDAPFPVPPPPPPAMWVGAPFYPEDDQRVLAMGMLLRTDGDAQKVIPILKTIALESDEPGAARLALIVLAQSGRPDARSCVVEVAKSGPEPVKIEAVRQLGRLKGPAVANELLQVYFSGTNPVKYQVVNSLGQVSRTSTFAIRERDGTLALMRIAQSEREPQLRDTAIVTLGDAGGVEQLRALYAKGGVAIKRPIVNGFFNAKAEDDLIAIVEKERDPAIRQYALTRLRLLGTERANAYLASLKQK
jgi:hypothetical protein